MMHEGGRTSDSIGRASLSYLGLTGAHPSRGYVTGHQATFVSRCTLSFEWLMYAREETRTRILESARALPRKKRFQHCDG
jgi:hypothetical protein